MATSGITLSGFNGIDFSKILDAVMQFESQPLLAMQQDENNVKNKDAAFVSLAGMISALQTPVSSLSTSTLFSNVSATSSDPSIATVQSGDGAMPGDYSVSITQLAKAQVTKSTNGYAATTDVAATGGTISFTINGTTTSDITVTSSTTLADLAQQINAQGSGVRAAVVNDGTNNKLVLTSRTTGQTNGFTVNNNLTNSSGAAIAFAAGQNETSGNAQNAQNALLNVNGIDIQSASNTITDALPGVTMTLLKAGDVSVSVATDLSSIKDTLNNLVTQYNKLRQFNAQQAKGVLGSDPVLREVLNDIKSVLLSANSNGGQYKYLAEIGIELTSTGDLSIDEAKLDEALNSHAADVQKLFNGDSGTNGVFNTLQATLNNLDGTAGLLKTTRDSIHKTLDKFDDRIEHEQQLLELRRQSLQKMYAAADQAISQLNQMSSSLSNLNRSI
jgi:flagellar hook-associated protein 2